MTKIDLNNYERFVKGVTSDTSLTLDTLIARLTELQDSIEVAPLLTGSIGLAGETGEFNDLVKKIVFQGKDLTADVKVHLLKELGDIIFYWSTAVRALGADPYAVIETNVNKLSDRYPGGFSVNKSETRKAADV